MRPSPAFLRAFVVAALAHVALVPALGAQGAADVVRGRVTDDSARVVGSAVVHVTRGPDRLVRQTTTDSAGRYDVRFEDGTGDYLVAVAAPGFRSAPTSSSAATLATPRDPRDPRGRAGPGAAAGACEQRRLAVRDRARRGGAVAGRRGRPGRPRRRR